MKRQRRTNTEDAERRRRAVVVNLALLASTLTGLSVGGSSPGRASSVRHAKGLTIMGYRLGNYPRPALLSPRPLGQVPIISTCVIT